MVRLNSPAIHLWRAAPVLITIVTGLIALASVSTLPSPVSAREEYRLATATPTAAPPPHPTATPPVPAVPPNRSASLARSDGLFTKIDGEPPPSIGVDALDNRLVGIDLGQLAEVTKSPIGARDPVTGKPPPPRKVILNLFDDVEFAGIVEHVEPTSSGHALWGGLEGVELGTMTLVVNGSVVVGTVRTPDAVYTIRTVGSGAYVVRQIDESSLLPLGEPLYGHSSTPDARPPLPPQGRGPTEPTPPGDTSTPYPTPIPVPIVPTAPLNPVPDEAPEGGLFSEVGGASPTSTGVETISRRVVGIDFTQLTEVTESPVGPKDLITVKPVQPQTLVLNLFDDVVFTGLVEQVEPTSSGHALRGKLEGVELGTFTLVVNGSVVVGTVRTHERVYTIRTVGVGTYVIRQIDESSLLPLGEPLEGPFSTPEARSGSDDVPPDDGSVIDVMVVYTPEAKHFEGGKAAIEALIDLFVAETNQANANSRVTHRIRLALREEVDYMEDGNSFIDLRRLLEDSDGYMDHVHELRDLYATDLVHIVVSRSVNVCGVAANIGGDERTGFALTVSECGGLTFAHEFGHNMGLAHDRYVVPNAGRRSNFGYVNQRMFDEGAPDSARWRTIMAYYDQCEEVGGFYCSNVAYFSNPEVTHNVDPTGVSVDNPSTGVDGPAHAVATLNDRREITANFRRSSASLTPRVHLTLSPYWLSENGGTSTVTATLHRHSSADTTVTVSTSPADAVRLSANRVLTIPAGQTVSAGAVTITGVDDGDQTGDVDVTISATAANPSSLGVVEPEPVELTIADDETAPVVTLSLSPAEIVEIDGRTFVTAMLDNRSVADTVVTVSATPAEVVEEIEENTLTIPAGQSASIGAGVEINAVDDSELTEAEKMVTVSGTATNSQGVTGPDSVTLTINDDEAPFFPYDSIAYTFTEGLAGSRFLPEAAYGKGPLTYSLSPAPGNGVTFTPGPPTRIGTSETSAAGPETSYTLTVTDADGVKDIMTISITVRKGVCSNSAAVSGYTNPGIVKDCEALLVSRDVLGGDKSLNWSEDLSIGEWQGVATDDEGRVVHLHLWENQLSGTMPSELGSLVNLQSLALQDNKLTGSIPPELGNLANLEELSLWGNQLTGLIPASLSSLANLRTLALNRNQLTGSIPPELGNLANLEELSLWGNQLTGLIPASLSSLANLRTLALNRNQLTGEIPTELGNLSNLEWLLLGNNLLTGEIPPKLGNLSNLQILDLAVNQLTGEIPTELGNLSNLEWLLLGNNRLTGCVPDVLRDVPRNDFPRLGLPFCSEHPCVTGGLVDVTDLGLMADCGTLLAARDVLAGTAPLNWSTDTRIADWSGVVVRGTPGRVTELRLSGLGLTGQIPPELGELPDLQHLDLSDNQLAGVIPAELGDLVNLQELYLEGNRLTGCVPDGLRDVPNNDLESLGLSFCSEHPCLSGGAVMDANNLGLMADCVTLLEARDTLTETASLNWEAATPITLWDGVIVDGTPQRVTELNLAERGLMGEIPAELGNLGGLQHLSLWKNQLTGDIPTELGNLASLQSLDLSLNQLTGVIPTELGSLANLSQLELIANQLTGEIPPELGNLANLRWLLLWENQLTGVIPTELGNLSNLRVLSLSSNQLMGEIPAKLGNLSNLERLYLSSNQLTGVIPTELSNLSNLQSLDLYDNRLTGEIPTELGNLSNLQGLVFSSNQLTGEIPAELGDLSNLIVLSLWGNQLTGRIPTELEYLSKLQTLWLGGNSLSGCIPPALREVPKNDLDDLGLSICSVSLPGAPTIDTVASGMATLVISWRPPSNRGGTAITSYDLRYVETAADDTMDSNWTVKEDVWTAGSGTLRYVLTGLTADAEYDIQVRAVNSVGDGPWSETTTGAPAGAGDCATGRAVSDPSNNPGLVSDCQTLLAVRDVLASPFADGKPRLNWSPDTPITDWDGIDDDSLEGSPTRLTRLYLNGLGLDGMIPSELSDLSALKVLHLHDNELTGTIPPALGGLPKLTYLFAHNNDLTGSIPTELGELTLLKRLFLHSNNLTGSIPVELGKLARLTHLWLKDNDLTGEIPSALGNMTSLDWLHIAENDISGGIPAELGTLTKLRRLYVYENDLSGPLPGELGGLTRLTHIVAQENDLSGEIPAELGNLTNLVWLGLYDNDLEGEIPEELGGLSKLQRLYLHHNELSGEIPEELGNLSDMTNLWLNHNYLSGQIPESLGDLTNLTRLRLAGNDFTGCLPAGLAAVSNSDADQLGLETCADTNSGSVSDAQDMLTHGEGNDPLSSTASETPAGAGDCATGRAVSDPSNNPGLVSDCQTLLAVRDVLASPLADGEPRLNWSSDTPITDWDGIGDDSLQGSPTRVTRLYLNGLGLDGMIAGELSDLSALKVLHLHDNELTGTIPPALGGLPKLTYLFAHNNDLTGSIPAELGELTSLKRLFLHSNDLTGSIPAELGKLTRLTHLWLKDNDLTGEIPSALGNMTSLDWLHIAENDISGGIPAELGTLTKLRRLYVYENDLSGPIPGELGGLTRLTHTVAQENDLSGEIPDELGNLTNLVWLGLYDNDLEDEIPEELGGLSKLQRLYLHHNELSGEIPEELGNLSDMTNLWLNHNYLSGQIPESLGDLTNLTRLRLAGNDFTGCLPAGLAAVSNSDADQLGLETCSEG